MDMLGQQYSTNQYAIGRGSFEKGLIVSGTLPSVISDQQVQGVLDNLIRQGYLAPEDGNRLYAVYTPPNVQVQRSGLIGPGPNSFLGYHDTFADPAIIQLRYADSVFEDAGRSRDIATISVAHANGANEPYADIPGCDGTAIPLGAFACLDRAASRDAFGTVVLVVRTIDTSRWLVP